MIDTATIPPPRRYFVDGDCVRLLRDYTGRDWRGNVHAAPVPLTIPAGTSGRVCLVHLGSQTAAIDFSDDLPNGERLGLSDVPFAVLNDSTLFEVTRVPDWRLRGFCCELAKALACVCALATDCPTHHTIHRGTHD
jgi:hypothetical protein